MHSTYRYRPRKRSVFAFPITLACLIGLQLGGCGTDAENVGSDQQPIGNPDPTITNPSAAHVVAIEDMLGEQFCTGTVLEDGSLLTAAHCLESPRTMATSSTSLANSYPRIRDSALAPTGELIVVGDRTQGSSRKGFIAWLDVATQLLEVASIPASTLDSQFESVAVNDLGAFVLATTFSATQVRKPVLYFFERLSSDSYAEGQEVTDLDLGGGEASRILAYKDGEFGFRHLLIASTNDSDGYPTSNLVTFAVDQAAGQLWHSAAKSVLSKKHFETQSLARLPDGRLAVGGTLTVDSAMGRVYLVKKSPANLEWAVDQTLKPPKSKVRKVELAIHRDELAVLVQRTVDDHNLYSWNLSTPSVVPDDKYVLSDFLEHYSFAHAERSNTSLNFQPQSITSISVSPTESRLYVGGSSTEKGQRSSVVVAYDHALDIERSFGVRGVRHHRTSSQEMPTTQQGLMTATSTSVFLPSIATIQKDGAFLQVATIVPAAPWNLFANQRRATSARFVNGRDIAVLTTLPAQDSGLPFSSTQSVPIGTELDCVGAAAGLGPSLGRFITGDQENDLTKVRSQGATANDGDSGSPCFTATGALAGMLMLSKFPARTTAYMEPASKIRELLTTP